MQSLTSDLGRAGTMDQPWPCHYRNVAAAPIMPQSCRRQYYHLQRKQYCPNLATQEAVLPPTKEAVLPQSCLTTGGSTYHKGSSTAPIMPHHRRQYYHKGSSTAPIMPHPHRRQYCPNFSGQKNQWRTLLISTLGQNACNN
jgi:hypothetical protein